MNCLIVIAVAISIISLVFSVRTSIAASRKIGNLGMWQQIMERRQKCLEDKVNSYAKQFEQQIGDTDN